MNFIVYAIIIVIVAFLLSLICPACYPCSGVDLYNPLCHASYSICQGSRTFCLGMTASISFVLYILGVLFGVIGLFQFIFKDRSF